MDESSRPSQIWPDGVDSAGGPLEGIRVLDFSRILAGPFSTMQLGDLGADVLKVEQPHVGDETRRWGPPFIAGPDGAESAAYFFAANRNKRAITLDLSTPSGRRLALGLCEEADVVVTNFLPDVARRLELDPHELRRRFPHLVVGVINGFGLDSDAANVPAFDAVVQAMGGLMSITGHPDGMPVKVGVPIADLAAGLYCTAGLLAGLFRRTSAQRGSLVEISLLDAQVALLTNQAMNHLAGGPTPRLLGNQHPTVVPYGAFDTADRPIVIGAATDGLFRSLCEALDLHHLAQLPEYSTNGKRLENYPALMGELDKVLGSMSAQEVHRRLTRFGVPNSLIRTVPEVFADPSVAARMLWNEGSPPQVRNPIRIDGEPLPVRLAPPPLGSSDHRIFADEVSAKQEEK